MSDFVDFILEAQTDSGLAKEFKRLLGQTPGELSRFFMDPDYARQEITHVGIVYNITPVESKKIIDAYKKARDKIEDQHPGMTDVVGPLAY